MPSPEASERAHIPETAYRRTGCLTQWQFWIPLVLFVGVAAWRAFDWLRPTLPGPVWHSPGRLASVHAPWDADCAACHDPLLPVRRVADTKCKKCHEGAVHHAVENPAHRPGCTACHREHRGHTASLLRVPDTQCLLCHTELKEHLAPGASTRFRDIHGFDEKRHEEFQVLREKVADPGQLTFNHWRHMNKGLRLTQNSKPFRLAQVEKRFQKQYSQYVDESDPQQPLQLDCSACHQLESGDAPLAPKQVAGVPLSAVFPARSSGAAMLPIVYEKHCQACHPLTFEPKVRPIPHRLQPDEVRKFLAGHYLAEQLTQLPPPADRPRARPGGGLDRDLKLLGELLAAPVRRAEQALYFGQQSCGQCHYRDQPAEQPPPDPWANLRVRPTQVPALWFEHAVFNHAAHRALKCSTCHARAYADSKDEEGTPNSSKSERDVLLPGIATCVQCHGPRSASGGGARHDCVECHRYHDGDNPRSGKGSKARAGQSRGSMEILPFLRKASP